jgi:type I restriction enzyme, S subunit
MENEVGKLVNDIWKEEILVDCLESLIDYRGKTPAKSEKGILTLSAKSVKMGKIDYSQAYCISQSTYKKFMTRGFPQKGDVLMTTEAPLGCIAILDRDDVAVAQRLLTLRGKKGVLDNGYLLYYLLSAKGQNELLVRASGTTVQGIKRTEFSKVKISLPPFSVQKSIAHILGSLDDKIELNRRINQTLEQMAQALFKSWFVDFDPVIDNALASGNPIPDELQERAQARQALGNNCKPLPAHVQQLFPNEFEFSEVLEKWVPRGWRVGKITDIAEVVGGGTPSTAIPEYFSEDGIAWLSPKDLSGFNGKFIGKGATDITPLGLKNSSAKLMPAGTVLFSSRAPIGYVAIAENEVTTNQGFKSLIPLEGMCSEYLYYYLKANKDGIEAIATGSTFKEVSGTAMKSLDIIVPDLKIIDHYARMTNDWNKRRLKDQKEITTLAQLRDSILPKLINGSIPIHNNLINHNL